MIRLHISNFDKIHPLYMKVIVYKFRMENNIFSIVQAIAVQRVLKMSKT